MSKETLLQLAFDLGHIETRAQKVQKEKEYFDIETEATIVHRATLGSNGSIIDQNTKQPLEEFAQIISRCKFGDLQAADELAGRIADAAMVDATFQKFLELSNEEQTLTIITSHGVYNVPTASALLLQGLSERLNISLSHQDKPTLITDEPIRIWIEEDYFQSHESMLRQPSRVIEEGRFSGHRVVFVDDMLTSPREAEHVKRLLVDKGGATAVHFLVGIALDPVAYETTNGLFEDLVNKRAITGTLDSLSELFAHPEHLTVTQRTLKAVLDPAHRLKLPEYLRTLPDLSLLKLFRAASHAEFKSRYNGTYKKGTQAISNELMMRGWISPEGFLYRKKKFNLAEHENATKSEQIVVHTLNSKRDISNEEAELYSRMKYSDPEAVEGIAQRMATAIMHNSEFQKVVSAGDDIIITPSAYGSVPTAAAYLTDHIEKFLIEKGVRLKRIKIHRRGNFSQQNFGSLAAEQRQAAMKARKITLDSESKELVQGAVVLAIDDLCATGSHERALHALLDESGVKKVFFAYDISFTEQLLVNEPDTEEFLNRISAKTAKDVLPWTNKDTPPILPNARMVKFIMTTSAETAQGISVEQRIADLQEFLDKASDETLLNLYHAATSDDGYSNLPEYVRGFQMLEDVMLTKGILNQEEVNRAHERVVSYSLTLDEAGRFIDAVTGEDRTEIANKYSLMKYGSVKEIKEFAVTIAQDCIQRFDNPDDHLTQLFTQAANYGQHVALVVPGSRNIESSSNFIFDEAVALINQELALRDLPTIIVVKLPRLGSNKANYALLSQAERAALPPTADHILPGKEFYQYGVNLLFADDVRITGATADAVRKSALENGALSYQSLYSVLVDPRVALARPDIEDYLNRYLIKGGLDENVRYILNQKGCRPVQRLVRLVLSKENRPYLEAFLQDIDVYNLGLLYRGALGNDYDKDEKYKDSLPIIRKVLADKGMLDASGKVIL